MKVLFVNMPFSSIRPAIGVSLLKSHLQRMEVDSDIAYLNLPLARHVGVERYLEVSDRAPRLTNLGDWIFAHCLFDRLTEQTGAYIDMVSARYPASTSMIPVALHIRDMAEDYLNECVKAIDWGQYDLVGFTTSFSQTVASLALARRVRERVPDVRIAFGGANCEEAMGLQLHRSFPFLDFVFSGEADISFPQLIQRLQNGEDPHGIAGVISRRDGESYCSDLHPERVFDMDGLPYPDYDDYLEQHQRNDLRTDIHWVLMETSRGCWWGAKSHCTFCGLNGLNMKYRAKSARRALDEILYLTERYKTSHLEMVDNILDLQYFRDLLPELRQRGIGLHMFYETKANLTRDQVRLLRDAGVDQIQPGIESFSGSVLRLMGKGTNAVQNIQLLKWCKEFGVKCHWNLLYGFPGEDEREYDAMIPLIDSLHHLDPPAGCGPVRMDRFSPNYVRAEQMGLTNVRADRSYSYVYDLPREELDNLAYHFEHDYADGREPTSYTHGLRAAVTRWVDNASRSGLVYVDDGARLSIQDFRVGMNEFTTVLDGPERAVYLYCDHNRSCKQILEYALRLGWAQEAVDTFLETMIEQHLMVLAEGRVVSLALPAVPAEREEDVDVPAPEDCMSDSELVHLKERLQTWSQGLSPRELRMIEQLLDVELQVGASQDAKA